MIRLKMTDSPVLNPNKIVSDSYALTEAPVFDVGSDQSDNLSMSDVFVPVMAFFRTFDDDYSFTDDEVFDIGKGLSDSTTFSEQQVFNVSSVLTDSSTISESIFLDFQETSLRYV